MIELCGKCLHNRESHTKDNIHFMFCAKCQNVCDMTDFNTNYKPSGIIVQDGIAYKVGRD